MKKDLLIVLVFLASFLAIGCGNNPEDKDVKMMNRTNQFTKLVSGRYETKGGDSVEFGEKRKVTFSTTHRFPLNVKKARDQKLEVDIDNDSVDGYFNRVRVATDQDLSEIEEGTEFSATLECDYQHVGKLEDVFWLPRPRNSEKQDFDIASLREHTKEVDFLIQFEDMSTQSIVPRVVVSENDLIDGILQNSQGLIAEAKVFCSDDTYRQIYKEVYDSRPRLPLKSFSPTEIEFFQINDNEMMKFSTFDSDEVVSGVFKKNE